MIELLHNHEIAPSDNQCTTCEDKDRAFEAMREALHAALQSGGLHQIGNVAAQQARYKARAALAMADAISGDPAATKGR